MQNTLLVFLSSYSLLAAIIALAVPSDMLRPQVFLTVYSFLYHILMVSLSLLSAIIIRRRDDVTFKYSIVLFLAMALIAEFINVISHMILHDIHLEPDMFYITPYYETTQPVFNLIAVRFGILAEVIIYLVLIILCSYLIYETIRKKL